MPDKDIDCAGCQDIFLFTEEDQDYYRQRGMSDPVYCATCRQTRRGSHGSELQSPSALDIALTCRDCGVSFIFSEREQEFYKQQGFENQPTRCRECRERKKQRFQERQPNRVSVPNQHYGNTPRVDASTYREGFNLSPQNSGNRRKPAGRGKGSRRGIRNR